MATIGRLDDQGNLLLDRGDGESLAECPRSFHMTRHMREVTRWCGLRCPLLQEGDTSILIACGSDATGAGLEFDKPGQGGDDDDDDWPPRRRAGAACAAPALEGYLGRPEVGPPA